MGEVSEKRAVVLDLDDPTHFYQRGGVAIMDVTRKPKAGNCVVVEERGRKVVKIHPSRGKVLGVLVAYQVPK